ncbi:HWE histidine kinase domain-containing protein [Fulvimarina endophytica]|nr:HWE histidine kinase domain-containing protein [Fulvimarina endophytica]
MTVSRNGGPTRRSLPWGKMPFTGTRLRPSRLVHLVLRPSLFVHLTMLTLIVLLPALLFSAFLIFRFSSQQQELAQSQVADMAEIVSNAFDREVVGLMATAQVLATSGTVERGEFEVFRERSVRAVKNTGIVADLIDPAGNLVVSTSDDLTIPEHERAVIAAARRSGQAGVSGVSYDPRLRRLVFLVAAPTTQLVGEPYVVVLSQPLKSLKTIIDDRNLPPSWSVMVEDADSEEIFSVGARNGRLVGVSGATPVRPQERIFETDDLLEASKISELTGWRSTVTVSNAMIDRPITRSWYALLLAGLVLTAFSILLGVLMARRIVRPIHALSQQASAIGRGEPAKTVTTDIAEIGEVSKVLNRASRDRIEAETQTQLLMREMTHRAKNQYALVAAIARRAARESADTGEFLATLSDALASLARSAELLSNQGWESVELSALVENQLSAFGVQSGRIRHDGPPLRINASVAQTIGLALHELATNAAKYGALSVEEGIVTIEWSYGEAFEMTWRESGGPKVRKPTRSGFGSLVTQKMTSRGLGGTVEMAFEETGVVWSLKAPATSAEPITGAGTAEQPSDKPA